MKYAFEINLGIPSATRTIIHGDARDSQHATQICYDIERLIMEVHQQGENVICMFSSSLEKYPETVSDPYNYNHDLNVVLTIGRYVIYVNG